MFFLHDTPLLLIVMVLMPHSGWHVYAQSISTTITSTSASTTIATTSASTSTSTTAAVTTSKASSSAVVATTSSASTSSAITTTSTKYTGTPSLVFGSIPTLTACSSNIFTWQIVNEDPALVNLTLYVINEGVDQSIPSASATSSSTSKASTTTTSTTSSSSKSSTTISTTSTALKPSTTTTSASSSALSSTTAKVTTSTSATSATATATTTSLTARSILNINMTLATTSGNHGWTFNPVKLPQARYYLLGVVHDGHGTTAKSGVFSVIEGSNKTCLTAFASESKTATATAKTTGTAVGAGSGSSSNKSGMSKGAIAGIVIGVILVLALGILALLYLRRRRQRAQIYGAGDRYTQPPMSNASAGGRHIKMSSGPTTSFDQGHGVPIALAALRSDGGDEKGRSNESLVETMAVDDNSHGRGPQEDVSNPFTTPHLEQRHESVYGGYTTSDFAPVSTSSSGGIGIREPSQAILRPLSYTDPRTSQRRQSGLGPGPSSSGDGVHRSASQSRLGSGQMTPPGIGLGISSGDTMPPGVPGVGGQIGRSSSTRRKPVPSLGPELRTQLQQQQQQQVKQTGLGQGQKNFKLVADPPKSERL